MICTRDFGDVVELREVRNLAGNGQGDALSSGKAWHKPGSRCVVISSTSLRGYNDISEAGRNNFCNTNVGCRVKPRPIVKRNGVGHGVTNSGSIIVDSFIQAEINHLDVKRDGSIIWLACATVVQYARNDWLVSIDDLSVVGHRSGRVDFD